MNIENLKDQFVAIDELIQLNTASAVANALGRFQDILQLHRRDPLRARDIIPHLLLRLDREEECYNFLKWWATVNNNGQFNKLEDWEDATLPFLEIRGADPFEPIGMLCWGGLSLNQLVALALLKLRLYLDTSAYQNHKDGTMLAEPHPIHCRPVGRLVRAKMRSVDSHSLPKMLELLKNQFLSVYRRIDEDNAHFWEALIAEETPTPRLPSTPGSKDEAYVVLHRYLRAWQETKDAIMTIDSERRTFTRVYQDTAASTDVGNARLKDPGMEKEGLKRRRGSGRVFPGQANFMDEMPAKTGLSARQTVRYISSNHPRRLVAYADGACINNGRLGPRVGWAVVCGPPGNDQCVASGRLEDKGPFGDDITATSNRAELRAAIAVLCL
ncbi:RNase H type-1 domain-containing protein [Fusarium sp. LHS14.1]|nr:RNase H type-1 domain-containing protein [Fusarium sp. LHS14.1]